MDEISNQSEIQRIQNNVAQTISELQELGVDATNSDDLPGAVRAIPRATIAQEMGDSPTAVMSQKAVTERLAAKEQGVYYIEGSGSVEGTWLGSHDDITEYYPGLTVLYKASVASASPTTLNINGLGAVTVVRNATTALSTTIPARAVVLLTYTEDSGTAYWKRADYDANTKTSSGTSEKTATKMYLVGGTSQSSSGVTTYTNKLCYVGKDNRLYSNGEVVPNTNDINGLIDAKLGAIENGTY